MVITLELSLGMVPSSSEDVTRAMRGQPKQMAGKSFCMFHSIDVFRNLSRLFVRLGLRLFCACFRFETKRNQNKREEKRLYRFLE